MIKGDWKPIDSIPEATDVLISTGDRQVVGFKHKADGRIYESYHSPSLIIASPQKWHPLPKASEI
jgi:hypothetical protein